MSAWRAQLQDRLSTAQRPDGGWGYAPATSSSPEPTALACLALSEPGIETAGAIRAGASYLRTLQGADGRVAVPGHSTASWPTALAVLAWKAAEAAGADVPGNACDRSVDWLLNARGRTFQGDPTIYGHDTELVGWSWIDDTHTWLEPTAYALLALRASDRADRARFREGVAVLRDRAIKGGGWNYGNNRMFGADLRPFSETTGMMLAALCGGPKDTIIHEGLRYLRKGLAELRSPLAAAWAIIGLGSWEDRPAGADRLLGDQAASVLSRPAAPCEDAMLMIAGEEPNAIHRVCRGRLEPAGNTS